VTTTTTAANSSVYANGENKYATDRVEAARKPKNQ